MRPSDTGAGDCRPPLHVHSPTVKRDWTPRRRTGKDSAYPANILPARNVDALRKGCRQQDRFRPSTKRDISRHTIPHTSATAVTELGCPASLVPPTSFRAHLGKSLVVDDRRTGLVFAHDQDLLRRAIGEMPPAGQSERRLENVAEIEHGFAVVRWEGHTMDRPMTRKTLAYLSLLLLLLAITPAIYGQAAPPWR